MSDPWADEDFKDGEYYSFKDVPHGTSVSGVILEIGKQPFTDNGVTKVVPQIKLRDDESGDEKTLSASAFRLKQLFVEKRPAVGDHVKVTQTGDESIGNGKRVKHWDLVVTPGGAPAAAPVAAAPAPVVATPAPEPVVAAAPAPAVTTAGVVDPAAAQAAIEAMDPATRQLLGL